MLRRKNKIEVFIALALLAVAGPGFPQSTSGEPNPSGQPVQISPSTPDGPGASQAPSTSPNQPSQLGPASTLDQPIAPGAESGAARTDQAGQTQKPDTLTQPAQPSQGGAQAQGNWSELRGKIIDQRQVGVAGTETPNTVVLLQTEDGQQVAIDLGPEGTLSGVNLRSGDAANIKGVMISVGGNPVFIARELDMGGKTWQVSRPKTDRFSRMETSGEQAQLAGTVQYFEDVDVRGGGGKNRVALIQTSDGRRMLIDLGPVNALQSITLNRGDQINVTGHHAWISGERSILFADQVTAGGQSLEIDRPPYDPGSQESGGQSSQPSSSPVQPGQTTPMQTTPGQTTPGQMQPGQAQPGQTQTDQVQPTQPGTVHFGPGQANPPMGTGTGQGTPESQGSQGSQGSSSTNANDL